MPKIREKQKLATFESYLISGIFYLKNSNIKLAQKYFLKAKSVESKFILKIMFPIHFIIGQIYQILNQCKIRIRKT